MATPWGNWRSRLSGATGATGCSGGCKASTCAWSSGVKGVLRSLYERVLQLAAENGVCGVRLYVEKGNVSAQEAYRRLGLTRAVFDMYEVDFVIDREHGE